MRLRVGAYSECDDDHHGVFKRSAGHDVAGLEVDGKQVLDRLGSRGVRLGV